MAINNDPTSASAAFYAVWAAAIANGGSYANIQPGITFFANLNKIGNFVPGGTAATTAAGTTPILIWWDYLQNGVASSVPGWTSVIPSDGTIAAYYTQAITTDARTRRPRASGRSSSTRRSDRTCSCRATLDRSN